MNEANSSLYINWVICLMFKNILVALDYSTTSPAVFAEALEMATSMEGRLMLLHVLSNTDEQAPRALVYPSLSYYPVIDNPFWHDYRQRWEAFEKENLEWLKGLSNQAIAQGIPTEFTQVYGTPSSSICELAKTWGAEVILMGSHGRRGLSELLLGSVSNDVMHHAPCSVLIVRHAVRSQSPPEPASPPSANDRGQTADASSDTVA